MMQEDDEWFEEQRPKQWDSFYGRYNQRVEHESHQGDDNEWNSGTMRHNYQSPQRLNQQHQSSNHQPSQQTHQYQTEYQRRQQHPAPIHMFSMEE
jgi:hypothetical protein